jgi:hypothetical protein
MFLAKCASFPPILLTRPHFSTQNPHFPIKNTHFPIKKHSFSPQNPIFPIKNPIFTMKTHFYYEKPPFPHEKVAKSAADLVKFGLLRAEKRANPRQRKKMRQAKERIQPNF